MRRTILGTIGIAASWTIAAPGATAQQAGNAATAQQHAPAALPRGPDTEVRGRVMDGGSGAPRAGASVTLRAAADSSLAGAAVARADGSFRIAGARPGRYVLRVAALGHAAASAPVALASATARADVGAVRLAPAAIALTAVTATASRAAVTVSADRTTYAGGQLAASGGTAADVLRRVPVLEVDGNGQVSLRGDPNVVVQINGRAPGMGPAQLAALLRQIPAAMVEKVEVVPNPSARDDAEGMSGIVNLQLKQSAGLGLNGGASLAGGTGDKLHADGNAGWQRGRVSAFAAAGYASDRHPQTGYDVRAPLAGGDTLTQVTDGSSGSRGASLNLTADVKLGARDVLSPYLFAVHDRGDVGTTSLSRGPTGGPASDASADGVSHTFANLGVQAKHTGAPGRPTLSFAADAFRNHGADVTDFTPLGDAASADAATRRTLDQTTHRELLQADATVPLGAGAKLDAGYKGIARRLDDAFSVAAGSAGGWTADPTQTGGVRYDQALQAGYVMGSRTAGRLQLQAGLRLESAANTFTRPDSATRWHSRWTDLFPSALAAINLDPSTQLKASYSRRVQRPEFRTLIPWRTFDDPQHASTGNPYLQPEYTDAFELGLQHSTAWGSLQLSPYYRRTTDAVGPVRSVDGAGVTLTTFRNFATRTTWGADASGSLRGSRLSGFGGLSVYHMVVDAGDVDPGRSVSGLAWSARASATWTADPRTTVQATAGYRGPVQSVTGRFGAFVTGDVSLVRKLDGDRATVSLRVTDPFALTRYQLDGGDPDAYHLTTRHFGTRAAYLTFTRTFGSTGRARPTPPPDPAAQNRPADPAAGG